MTGSLIGVILAGLGIFMCGTRAIAADCRDARTAWVTATTWAMVAAIWAAES